MVSGWPAAVMHPNHWHCPVVVYTPTEYGGSPECDVEEWAVPTHAEAVALLGRDDDLWGRND
jgi:hypothetical protein